jgi:hypothetical protein
LGPEGGIPVRPTQAIRHTCSGNLGIVKIAIIIIFLVHPAVQTNINKLYI